MLIWDSKDQELRCRLAAKCINTPGRYKLLAEWLDVYRYVPPDSRYLNQGWTQIRYDTPSDIFKLWLFLDLIYCCLYVNEQDKVWELLLTHK